MLTALQINGLRGFASNQTLQIAIPTGELGSGLTILVGANSAGKSTAIEALRALVQRDNPSFTSGRRNRRAGDIVQLRIIDQGDRAIQLRSLLPESSETERVLENRGFDLNRVIVLPSRRTFNPYFGRGDVSRTDYMTHIGFPAIRTSSVDQFASRLFSANKNHDAFNAVLGKVLDPVPSWTIDQMDTGQYFLKITAGDAAHSSEGLGEGLVSLFYIVDALYDSAPGDTIAIDEPELSLHPALQRKLSALLTEHASNKQILLATHSPYFVNLEALQNGATVARVYLKEGQSQIAQLSSDSAHGISKLLRNYNNPHIFGLNAQEVFFLDDRVILVEGQEDVVFYQRVQQQLGEDLDGTFFGWGVGGAGNMQLIAGVLRDLGFLRVTGILDKNEADRVAILSEQFPNFHFFAIPANDVRSKQGVAARPAVLGLLDDTNENIRPEHTEETQQLFSAANRYLRTGVTA